VISGWQVSKLLPLKTSGWHPDFPSESPYCQEHMRKFSQALAGMRHESFVPKSTSEAKPSDLVIAEDAARSPLRPIPDGPDQWEVHRRCDVSGSGGPAPG
jgi:hypothetical protein